LIGDAAGFSVELCRLCLSEASEEVEFVAADGPLTQSIWLATGRVDAVLDMTSSVRRTQWFDFSAAYYVDELAAFAPRDGPLWPGLERMRGAIAVKSNSYAEEWLRRHLPRLRQAARPQLDLEAGRQLDVLQGGVDLLVGESGRRRKRVEHLRFTSTA